MALKAWDLHAKLEFPIHGKTYVVPEINWSDGQKLAAIWIGGDSSASSDVLFRLAMGDTWDEMLTDGVSARIMFRAGMASVTFHIAALNDDDDAEKVAAAVWESGISPEAVAATLAATLKASTDSTVTDAAPVTRSRASTSGTRTSRPRKKAAA